jgi:transposase-like protein
VSDGNPHGSPDGQRAVPYVCPFCGEEDLRPVEAASGSGSGPGRWGCRSCLRVFAIQFFGLHRPDPIPSLPGVEQP